MVCLSPKLPKGKEARDEVITSVVRVPKDEPDHEFNQEPNNKWKLKREQIFVHRMSKHEISAKRDQHIPLDSLTA